MALIKVPITIGFNSALPVGILEIEEDSLPISPHFVFSIGYMAKKVEAGGLVTSYDLVEVGMLSEDQYIKYLISIGKIDG